MKLIVSSDIHNDFGMIYKIIELYKKERPDYIVILGDISEFGEIEKGLIKKLTEYINPNKILIIPGNHETSEDIELLEKIYKIRNLDKRYIIKDNFVLVGFGGADVLLNVIDEKEFEEFLNELKKKINDKYIILLTHIPPKGSISSLDISGSYALRKFIQNNDKVILNIHGHMHETGGLEDIINKAKILNVAREVKLVEIYDKKTKIK
ncbi:metallophosphoesterase family protein [Candidatus Nanobsidianus stetteri]|uniref:Metallophosphoesterase n=1 Tax=Nanobsidianus stetteri TaxID=1294122 RepID=A0A2T9WLJ8_NANST|nr:metallophosphoesterase [Candidatus Nanobsidianus stetteri]MCC5447063.1 metallophosphoesterase [Candidatus Nanobsidianus stetteri]